MRHASYLTPWKFPSFSLTTEDILCFYHVIEKLFFSESSSYWSSVKSFFESLSITFALVLQVWCKSFLLTLLSVLIWRLKAINNHYERWEGWGTWGHPFTLASVSMARFFFKIWCKSVIWGPKIYGNPFNKSGWRLRFESRLGKYGDIVPARLSTSVFNINSISLLCI